MYLCRIQKCNFGVVGGEENMDSSYLGGRIKIETPLSLSPFFDGTLFITDSISLFTAGLFGFPVSSLVDFGREFIHTLKLIFY